MTIQELAERKTLLSQKLEAFSMCNVYGKSMEDLTALNLEQIKTQKEMFDVQKQIQDYIEGRAT